MHTITHNLNKTTYNTLSNENDSKFRYGRTKKLKFELIHNRINDIVCQFPENIAVEHADKKISYLELDIRSKQVANIINFIGETNKKNIGLFLERSIEMIIGIYGILRSGCAYVPQDIRITPINALQNIVDVASINVVFSLRKFSTILEQINGIEILYLDDLPSMPISFKSGCVDINPNNNCFILFTSGTTGKPNGVQVSHKNVCNLISTTPGSLFVNQHDRVSQVMNIAFDMAAWEIFLALCYGATLVIRSVSIADCAKEVSILISTPSMLSTINPDDCKKIHTIALAGEPCSLALANLWENRCNFYNCCGPTETTIVNTMQLYKASVSKLNIGKPTPNNSVYILDENMNPCKLGEIGEMWAGGLCVTNGYIGNDILTNDRYRPDPFLGNGNVMFRTRDLGRWTINGELEHLGRVDDQVKVKGFRVELDAINKLIEECTGCQRATTIKVDSNTLISFVMPSSLCVESIKNHIKKYLPYYAIPEEIITLDSFPMTNRGKIDRKLLEEIYISK